MKKKLLFLPMSLLAMSIAFSACSDDDYPGIPEEVSPEAQANNQLKVLSYKALGLDATIDQEKKVIKLRFPLATTKDERKGVVPEFTVSEQTLSSNPAVGDKIDYNKASGIALFGDAQTFSTYTIDAKIDSIEVTGISFKDTDAKLIKKVVIDNETGDVRISVDPSLDITALILELETEAHTTAPEVPFNFELANKQITLNNSFGDTKQFTFEVVEYDEFSPWGDWKKSKMEYHVVCQPADIAPELEKYFNGVEFLAEAVERYTNCKVNVTDTHFTFSKTNEQGTEDVIVSDFTYDPSTKIGDIQDPDGALGLFKMVKAGNGYLLMEGQEEIVDYVTAMMTLPADDEWIEKIGIHKPANFDITYLSVKITLEN